jgi:hypothetical protein
MSKEANYNDLSIAKEFGIEAVSLRDTTKDFEEVWNDFVKRLKKSVDAVRNNSTKAPMICGILRKSNSKVRTPFFKIGYGRGNYWFPNGVHLKGKGLDLVLHRDLIEKLDSARNLELLKPYVRAKFDAECAKGRKGREKKLANTAIGYGTVEFVSTAANDGGVSNIVNINIA